MPLTDDGYDPSDDDALFASLEDTLTEIDPDKATGEGTVNRALLQTIALLLASNQEQSLDVLYDAAYIETASSENLDRRTNDIGIQRKQAVPATGVVEVGRGNEPSGDFTLSKGTLVQPPGSDTPVFETTELGTIGILDDFESGSLDSGYQGDTGSFSVIDGSASGDPDPDDGSYALEAPATSGTAIYHSNETVEDGDTIRFSLYLQANTVLDCLFHAADLNNHYRVTTDASGDTFSLTKVDGGKTTQLASTSVSVPTDSWLTVEIDTGINTDTEATLIDSNDDGIATIDTSDDTYDDGNIGYRSGDGNATKFVDTIVTRTTAVTIEGTRGGTDTNVGPNAITEFTSSVTGFTFVTNPVATGDTSHETTDGTSFVVGQDREDDEDLRQRALDSTAIGGATTVPAIGTGLGALDDVVNVRVFENDTLNDNTGSGGLPPVSIEIVVYGGDDTEVGERIFDLTAPTQRLYSGAHGSTTTITVTSDVLNDDEDIEYSRPPRLDVDLTLDIVVDDTYVGDDSIKRRVVEYIGGTLPNGATVTGTGIGENVRIDAIRDRIVGSDTGVRGLSSVTTTPSTTTDSNGLTVVETTDEEVAETDGTDGSITLSVTQV